MLNLLDDVYNRGYIGTVIPWRGKKAVTYEHLLVTPEKLEISGEHMMADAGPLRYREDFFGADEVITNYEPGKNFWVATVINTGISRGSAVQTAGCN